MSWTFISYIFMSFTIWRSSLTNLMVFIIHLSNYTTCYWWANWHWPHYCRQNCDINAVKALRKFYQRPYFLSSSVSPAHFNWVLMSSDYNTKIYKKVSNAITHISTNFQLTLIQCIRKNISLMVFQIYFILYFRPSWQNTALALEWGNSPRPCN